MKTNRLPLLLALAALFVNLTATDSSAQRRARLRADQVNDAQVVRTPGTTYADEAAHEYNQQSRQERWNQASPNQKATTYNVANSKHQQKETNKANATAAVTKRASTRTARF